jgi:hypothetical protein
VVFNVELAVSPTEYAVDGRPDPKRYIPGEYLFQDTIRIQLVRVDDNRWQLFYGLTNRDRWGEEEGERADETADGVFAIKLDTNKFSGTLRIVLTRMTDEPAVSQFAVHTADKGGPSGGQAIDEAEARRKEKFRFREFELDEQTEDEKEKKKKKVGEPQPA